ncbi:MAG: 30S ribosomal protein S6 [candidate division KSB1 bacterium]|nr:30S ribosomal protein S6 [candidate division KSB1 bacterium]
MLRAYETTFVIDSLLRAEELDETIRRYLKFISDNGGEIRRVERWGKRRLAYEIRKRQYGYYVYVRFDGPPAIVAALEREYRLDENVLRYLTIQLSKAALEKERQLIEQGLIKTAAEATGPEAEKAASEEPTEPMAEGVEEGEIREEDQPSDAEAVGDEG